MDLGKTLLAIVPIIWLILSLGVFKMRGDIACLIGLGITIVLSIVGFGFPVMHSVTAALEGVTMAIWPIVYVIITAVFIYNVSKESGGMDTIMKMLTSISSDMRVLVLLLAWGLGGFLEAVAGFGTAVAIPASILAVLGMSPVQAAVICLIANTTPTAFGAIGLPVATLAQVTGLEVKQLSYIVSIQLFLLIVLIPFVLVALTEKKGFKSFKGVFGITLASGLAFGVPQVFVAKYLGAELPSIVGSLVCILVTVIMAKAMSKRNNESVSEDDTVTREAAIKAWLPFILVFIFIIFSSTLFPTINGALSNVKSQFPIYIGEGAKPYTIAWLTTPGTLILLATVIGGRIQGLSFSKVFSIFFSTVKQMGKTMITVGSIVGLSKVMGYSGMIEVIAVSLVATTGSFYPFIAPIIGALGTFITGSDTSSNVLFGELQVQAANSLKVDPFWLAGANMAGATAGKMISPQSIAVATGATGLVGEEGNILKQAMKYCAVYTLIICCVVFGLGKLLAFI
ncbi:MAG: L-lactate permease [Vagococcus sp.]